MEAGETLLRKFNARFVISIGPFGGNGARGCSASSALRLISKRCLSRLQVL